MNTATDMEVGMLLESAHRFLAEKHDALIQGRYREPGQLAELWRECIDLGWMLTCVPVQDDGAGMDTAAAATLLEAVGASLLPLPVAHGVSAAALAAAVKPGAHVPLLDAWLGAEISAGIVEGQYVRYASGDTALRLAWATGELSVESVEATPATYGIDPLLPVARASEAQSRTVVACDEAVWRQYVARCRALTLAEALGAASGALALAIDYARERVQFGRSVAANQAIKHSLANNRMALDDARLALHDACAAIDAAAPDCERRLLMAELLVQEAAHATVAQAIQTHGAMGFTWECPVHFHYKRVKHFAAALRQEHDSAAILDRLWRLAA